MDSHFYTKLPKSIDIFDSSMKVIYTFKLVVNKLRHFYIWGPVNVGKSSILNLIAENYGDEGVVWVANPYKGWWTNLSKSKLLTTRFILLDEYQNEKDFDLTSLCLLADMSFVFD